MKTGIRLHHAAIWAISAVVVLGLPATNWLYWPAVLRAGVLAPDADSIMIPMFGGVIIAVALMPVVALITWLCTRNRSDHFDFAAWKSDRPVFSSIVTAFAALPFVVGILLFEEEITAPRGW